MREKNKITSAEVTNALLELNTLAIYVFKNPHLRETAHVMRFVFLSRRVAAYYVESVVRLKLSDRMQQSFYRAGLFHIKQAGEAADFLGETHKIHQVRIDSGNGESIQAIYYEYRLCVWELGMFYFNQGKQQKKTQYYQQAVDCFHIVADVLYSPDDSFTCPRTQKSVHLQADALDKIAHLYISYLPAPDKTVDHWHLASCYTTRRKFYLWEQSVTSGLATPRAGTWYSQIVAKHALKLADAYRTGLIQGEVWIGQSVPRARYYYMIALKVDPEVGDAQSIIAMAEAGLEQLPQPRRRESVDDITCHMRTQTPTPTSEGKPKHFTFRDVAPQTMYGEGGSRCSSRTGFVHLSRDEQTGVHKENKPVAKANM